MELMTAPLNGQLSLVPDGSYLYEPDGNYAGQDVFSYRVTVDGHTSSIATVTIDVANLVDLAGSVFDDLNNNGIQDSGEPGLVGVSLSILDAADISIGAAETAAEGSYLFDVNLPPGTYRIVQTQPIDYLDGIETAGSLGGTVLNGNDSNTITQIVIAAGDPDSGGYNFAEIRPSRIQGLVWEDIDGNGTVDSGERAIEAVQIALTGTDDRGAVVDRVMETDSQGIFEFTDLRPGTYTLSEQQPTGYTDGPDTLGTINGAIAGSNAVDDVFAELALTPDSDAINYNFGEYLIAGEAIQGGQTATIGFWQNKNGQNLIKALNGGESAIDLGHWLATQFPNMFGSLDGHTNSEVASRYQSLFKRNAKTAPGGGPPKLDAQVMALAIATYVTSEQLAGAVAEDYGFLVTAQGVGTSTYDVGDENRDAFGLDASDSTTMTVLAILKATDALSSNGRLYDVAESEDEEWETLLRTMANDVYSKINELGNI
jgi:hypothetical protein